MTEQPTEERDDVAALRDAAALALTNRSPARRAGDHGLGPAFMRPVATAWDQLANMREAIGANSNALDYERSMIDAAREFLRLGEQPR